MIEVEHLTKYYGDHLAVDDLSFNISSGHVYGFLGPNGAGKSTTMNIITGCLSPTEGTVRIGGHDIMEEALEARKLIGYLPEQPPLYLNESALDYLRFVGEAKGLKGRELEEKIADAVHRTGIEKVAHKRMSSLSKGYRQRVGIAQAILGDPEVIILDEPTVGLDPLQIIEIRELIRSLGEEHTVIFSSHILSEVQTICDEILMISHGKLVAFDTPENLERLMRSSNEVTVLTDVSKEQAAEILSGMMTEDMITAVQETSGYTRLKLTACTPAPDNEGTADGEQDIYEFSKSVYRAFAAAGRDIMELSVRKAGLEDIFIELAEKDHSEAEAGPEASGEKEATA